MSDKKNLLEKKSYNLFESDIVNGKGSVIISTPDIDSYNDIVEQKAIDIDAIEGNPLTYEHDMNRQIGVIYKPIQDEQKTIVRFTITEKDMKKKAKGYAASIGFNAIEWKDENGNLHSGPRPEEYKGIRRLTKIDVMEVALTKIPANENCKLLEYKSVNTTFNYPIAPLSMVWDQSNEDKEVRILTKATEEPNEQYANCFLWYNEDATDNFTSYKMQIVGVDDGILKIFPRALSNAKARLSQLDVSQSDKNKISTIIDKLQVRVSEYFNKETKSIETRKDLADYLKRNTDFSGSQADIIIETAEKINFSVFEKKYLTIKKSEVKEYSGSNVEPSDIRNDGLAIATDSSVESKKQLEKSLLKILKVK